MYRQRWPHRPLSPVAHTPRHHCRRGRFIVRAAITPFWTPRRAHGQGRRRDTPHARTVAEPSLVKTSPATTASLVPTLVPTLVLLPSV